MIKIKLCGFVDKKNVDIAISCGVDFIGFVFCDKSPRNITPENSKKIAADLPKDIKKVAVMVDADDQEITQIIDYLRPDFLQIHGSQTLERIKQIKDLFNIKIIKAIAISSEEDLKLVEEYEGVVDMFLFDAKNPGSGESFDWRILQDIKTSKEWFLSGGLNINNIDEAISVTGAKMVDLSSGIEEIRGTKSEKLILEFMNHFNDS